MIDTVGKNSASQSQGAGFNLRLYLDLNICSTFFSWADSAIHPFKVGKCGVPASAGS